MMSAEVCMSLHCLDLGWEGHTYCHDCMGLYRTETEVCVHSVEQAVGVGMYNKEKK